MQNVSGYSINDILEKYARHRISNNFWTKFHEKLYTYLEQFQHRIGLLENILVHNKYPKIIVD